MSKVHPKDHFHFQAIIHSGEYFVSPRIRTEDFSTLASFAASALARDGLPVWIPGWKARSCSYIMTAAMALAGIVHYFLGMASVAERLIAMESSTP